MSVSHEVIIESMSVFHDVLVVVGNDGVCFGEELGNGVILVQFLGLEGGV